MTKKRIIIIIISSVLAILSVTGLVLGIVLTDNNKKMMKLNNIESITFWTDNPSNIFTRESTYLYLIEKINMFSLSDNKFLCEITEETTKAIKTNIHTTTKHQSKETLIDPSFIDFSILEDISRNPNNIYTSQKFSGKQVYFEVYLTPIKNCDILIKYVSNQHVTISYPIHLDTYRTITLPQNQVTMIEHY